MKTRGSWVTVLKFAGVTVLISSLGLLATFRSPGKRVHETGVGVSPVTSSEASRLARRNPGSKWTEAYGKLPLSFEENMGQTAQEVRYISHGAGYELFLTPQEAVLALRTPVSRDLSPLHRFKTLRAIREAARTRRMTAVRIQFEGANPATQISATDKLLKKTNYFIGNDPQKWRTDVASYARVRYADVYPGVDLVFYGNQSRLEYDFVVAPGADPKAIRLNLQGARSLRISANGDVVLNVSGGELTLQKPVVYQVVKGERHEIAGSYTIAKGHQVRFSVPAYDRSERLILDPVLNYSTYLGGSSDEQGSGIAVDGTGNVFVAGTTFSTDFVTTGSALPSVGNAAGTVFVTEMNPAATAEVYSTYLGGSTGELPGAGFCLAVDPSGKIYVTGSTISTDFPTTSNGLKSGSNPGNVLGTSFISKIDPALSGTNSLVYSSYIGGTNGDFGNSVAVDASGNAYVTGITLSPPTAGPVFALTDFPVLNAYQATPSDVTDGNAFLTRIDTTKSGNASLIYSTYLGGTGANAAVFQFYADQGFGVAVDGSNNAYIVGVTTSTDFPMTSPTPNGYQTTAPVGNTDGTAFVARIDTTKSGNASLIYSTYLGGQNRDEGVGIALGPSNVAYVTGKTLSTNFPTFPAGAFQTSGGNAFGTAFVSLVDTGVSGAASLKYSTYLGGTGGDTGIGIRADSAGNAYVVGSTSSSIDFPRTPGALQPVSLGAAAEGFVSKINPAGGGASDLVYSTFFGGSGGGGANQDEVDAIALDAANNAFVTGVTYSSDFPVFPAGAFQTTLNGTSDAFIAKLTLIPTLVVSPTSLNFGTILIPNTSPAQSVTLTNNTNAAIAFASAAIANGSPAAANTDFAISANTCGVSIAAGATCSVSVTFKPTVVAPPTPSETATLVLTDADSTSPQNISLTGSGTNTPPDFTVTGPATATVKAGSQVSFTVTVTPVGGFSSPVALTCTEPPALSLSTCTALPASVTPNGAAVPSQVTVTTTALMVPPARVPTPPVSMRQIVPLILALMLLFLLPKTQRLRTRLGMVTAMILFIVLAGCSGPAKPHTNPGVYDLTITGTSGATVHTATVALTVN